VGEGVETGAHPIPPLSTWQECTLDTQVKLEAKSCIYDRLLYFQSERTMGYDVCKEEFNEGVYIFEDTMENWRNATAASTLMRSARWHQVVNAYTSDVCGVGEVFGETKALVFRGSEVRSAVTQDLDVSSGGKLEFELFLPPLGWDSTNPFCRTGFQGKVYAEYSTDQGGNWTILKVFDPKFDRSSKFILSSLDIPSEGATNQTRFRFIQRFFDASLDNWALDNVRVLRLLPKDWSYSDAFRANVRKAQDFIQKAQCCLDTDWCEQRFTAEETKQCSELFSWYTGENYLIRLSEILLCFACLVNVLKFLYISGQDWYMKSRFPFQDEVLEIMSLGAVERWIKQVPLQYRPKKIIPDEFTANIHKSARMEEALRKQVADVEGQGDMLHRKEVIERERKRAQKKIRKAQRKLETRKAQKNFRSSTVEEALQEGLEEDSKVNELEEHAPVVEGGFSASEGFSTTFAVADSLTTDLDRFQRQNHHLLRVPFEVEHSRQWRTTFAVTTLLVFAVLFLFELSYVKPYTIREPVKPYGTLHGEISLSSYGMIFFAAYCDLKEIFHVLKYVVPARDAWLPQVTLDLSDEVRSLIVANFIVPVSEIKEYGAFSENYILYCAAGYSLGVFPWCLFAMLLREAVLSYASMRVVTPLLGSIAVIRAVLGPAFVIKAYNAVSFLFDCTFATREEMGVKFQTTKTQNTAINTALALSVLALFICSAVAFEWLGIIFAVALFGGVAYGAFTGCIHDLPIRPWMYLTTLRAGVWMKVKKRQRCPCLYWGKYCTEMHNYEEVFVLFVEDEVKFMALINGGIQNAFAK
jgi:hypothetical protein